MAKMIMIEVSRYALRKLELVLELDKGNTKQDYNGLIIFLVDRYLEELKEGEDGSA